MQLTPEWVPLDHVVTTQVGVKISGLLDETGKSYSGDNYPHFVYWQGRYYLEDGHHRVVRAWIKGQRVVAARVARP